MTVKRVCVRARVCVEEPRRVVRAGVCKVRRGCVGWRLFYHFSLPGCMH